MVEKPDFVDSVLNSFKNILGEVEKGSSEHDIRYKFVKYFLEDVLGYEPRLIKWEKKRADLTIIDDNNFSVIMIETKRPQEDIEKASIEEQAFKYEEGTTKYIGLTNFSRFKLWETKDSKRELKADIDFSRLIERKSELSTEDKGNILFLNNLTKDQIFDARKYEKFDETYAKIDITKDVGFRKLLEKLNFIANNLLLGYTLKAFGEYKEGYGRYLEELKQVEKVSNNSHKEINHGVAKFKQKLEEKYEKYRTFSGYYLWKEYSGKENITDDEIKEVFCKETIYVFLNKLLFLRICEDKGLLEKNISNGGIEELRAVLKKRFEKDILNKEILKLAFESAKGLYSHFYETGILDWFRTGDGELNELLNRVLWIMNSFNFRHVDRDILGNLYEKYLPSNERKRLGEFYTPVEVIDYILTSVGYTYSYDIETKDLLDPACGSGGFLVRGTRRLISRYLMKFGKSDKKELRDPKNWKEIVSRLSPDEAKIILESIKEHIYGLDVNPFACHIAEMNLLFQVVDLYQKAREKYRDYKLGRFKIYRTDSLEKPSQKQIFDYTHSTFLEEQEEIDKIKSKKFDFVTGNPPYIRVQMLDERVKKYITENYKTAYSNFDLYVIFIERGLNWLKDNGNFGYITSNQFINREYGKKLRKYILENSKIISIIDFGDSGVFKDATNYPMILIFKRGTQKSNRFKFIKVKQSKDNLIGDIFSKFKEKEYNGPYFDIFEIEQNKLSEETWQLFSGTIIKILEKLEKNIKLKDLCRENGVVVGVQTGLNDVYVVNKDTINKYKLESSLIKKLLDSRDVRRWKINHSGLYLIYPYYERGGKTILIDEKTLKSDFSNVYSYLLENKNKLIKRWGVKNCWYELPTARTLNFFEQKKILTPTISNFNNFALDTNGLFFAKGAGGSYGIILKNDSKDNYLYILGLINSRLLEFYLKQFLPVKAGGWYEYIAAYLEKLPIKLPETAEEKKITNQIIKKVDEILELHKSGIVDIDTALENVETEKLCNLPKITFNIKDDAKFEKVKTEGNKIYINSQDFIEVKDKKLKDFVEMYLNFNSEKLSKDIKSMLINIPIPKSDEILKDVIAKGGIDYSQIKEEIRKLEQEINDLVYQIYGITKEEQHVIDNSIK